MPKRNAMVIRRIENEQGCTLSRSAEKPTSGKSHTPSSLILQRKVENPELYFSATMKMMAQSATAPLIIIFLIVLGLYDSFYFKREFLTVAICKCHKSIYGTKASRSMSVRIIDHFNHTTLTDLNDFIGRRNRSSMSGHAERALNGFIQADNIRGCAHTGGDNRFYRDFLIG